MRSYFYVGIYGYGLCPRSGGEGVESALPGGLAPARDRPAARAGGAARSPSGRTRRSTRMRGPSRAPVWVEAAHGYRTPMCAAIAMAGQHVYEWADAFTELVPADHHQHDRRDGDRQPVPGRRPRPGGRRG